ncbi:flavin monoamine oxidase family protein [Lihuaxuella thermophila]|nr:flavin monoamine oxidase family protein [Lihuaxuella thermophila]
MTHERAMRLTLGQMREAIRNGLKKTAFPKKIIVVGAGMAGLVAASLLKKAGHEVKILEASDRVGGRVYSIRSPFTHGGYLEAGAMRIPNTHHLTLDYIRKFRLPLNEFINAIPNDIHYVNGVKTRAHVYQRNPDILRYPVAPHERGKTVEQLLEEAVRPIVDFIREDPERNWDIVARNYDHYSFETFLLNNPVGKSLSRGALEKLKVLMGVEGFPELSFSEIFRDIVDIIFNPDIRFYEVEGGNERLPRSFLPQLKENILFRHELKKIVQHRDSVTLHAIHTVTRKPLQLTADLAIITIPLTLMQFVQVEPRESFSRDKWQAIRELHYVQSDKIGIQFKTKFWEKHGMRGGKTITDLPIRFAYYPSHGIGEPGPGVMLASYTWEDDSLLWESKGKKRSIEEALRQLSVIHGKQVFRHFQTGVYHSWTTWPYSAGAFTIFKPGQRTDFGHRIASPEGRVHFAGEHTSEIHGWIQSAIESGIRVAFEVNDIPKFISAGK